MHRHKRPWSFAHAHRAALVAFVLLAPAAQAEDRVLFLVGVGLECIEDGRFVDTQREVWDYLSCSRSSGSSVACSLTATMIKGCLLDNPVIAVGSPPVKVKRFDAARGRMAFTVTYGDEPADCVLEFSRRVSPDPSLNFVHGSADLVHALSCSMTHKNFDGTSTVLETRLPAKSYEWKPPCGYWLLGADNRRRGE